MNDFENELRKQPIRRVPEHWRSQILASRGCALPQADPWWAALLWPSPKAWGTLAAAWALMICFSVATREATGPTEKQEATQIRMAVEAKRRLQTEIEEASLRLDPQPKPRSDNAAMSQSA